MEEYCAVDDGDCDGVSQLKVIRYPIGERPRLVTTIVDGGMLAYPEEVVRRLQSSPTDTLHFCINTGALLAPMTKKE